MVINQWKIKATKHKLNSKEISLHLTFLKHKVCNKNIVSLPIHTAVAQKNMFLISKQKEGIVGLLMANPVIKWKEEINVILIKVRSVTTQMVLILWTTALLQI